MEGKDILILIGSYFLGCFNTGYYYTRFIYQQDIRNVGTQVTGAMNVSRLAGKKGFIITFLGDAIKGALVVALCRLFTDNDTVALSSILLVLTGHIFPVQLRFRGGKGLSTAFGAFLVYEPSILIYVLITCVFLFLFLRRYTITSLFALFILPLELFIMDYPGLVITFFTGYTILILFACRSNLKEFIRERAYQGKDRNGDKGSV